LALALADAYDSQKGVTDQWYPGAFIPIPGGRSLRLVKKSGGSFVNHAG